MSLATNKNTYNKVELSMNEIHKEAISAIVTITHKHRTNILEQQMNRAKIMSMIMTTTTVVTKI